MGTERSTGEQQGRGLSQVTWWSLWHLLFPCTGRMSSQSRSVDVCLETLCFHKGSGLESAQSLFVSWSWFPFNTLLLWTDVSQSDRCANKSDVHRTCWWAESCYWHLVKVRSHDASVLRILALPLLHFNTCRWEFTVNLQICMFIQQKHWLGFEM